MNTDQNKFQRQNKKMINTDQQFARTGGFENLKSPEYNNQFQFTSPKEQYNFTSPKENIQRRYTISENVEKDEKIGRKSSGQFQIDDFSTQDIYLNVQAIIENAECYENENIFIQYSFKAGHFWKLKNGNDSGYTQYASSNNIYNKHVTFNFPIELIYQTKNINGWPQILLTVYAQDQFGKQVLEGYGSLHIPAQDGIFEKKVLLYKPLPLSWMTGLIGYITGKSPQFLNPQKSMSQGDGREVVRVKSTGYVMIKFNISTQNFEKFGYKAV